MADDREEIGLDVEITSEGEQILVDTAEGLRAVRKEYILLNKASGEATSEAIAKARQLADELRASARNISILRKKFRDEERAAEKAASAARLAEERAYAEDARRTAKSLADSRKAQEKEVTQRLRVEKAERQAYIEDEKRSAESAAKSVKETRLRQEKDVTQRLRVERAERLAYAEQEKRANEAAAKSARDTRVRQEKEVTFQLRKEKDERIAYRMEERRNADALARAERAQRIASAQAAREQAAAERARVAASNSVRAGVVALRNEVLKLAAVFVGFRAMDNFIREGIEFNRIIETATLGIGSLIAAQVTMKDETGRTVDGAEKLAVSMALASDQVDKLRVDSLKTTATTEQLVFAFQQATGIGLRFGLTLDQIRKLAVQMAQAAGAAGLPLNQLSEEIRSLMQGTITPRNTRVATLLGITNEDIRAAQQAGTLFEFITKRLEAFSVAGDRTAKTFAGIMSNVVETAQTIAGTVTKPLFDEIKTSAQQGLKLVFDFDTAQVADRFDTIMEFAKRTFGGIGELLADAIEAAVEGAESLNNWLEANKSTIDDIYNAVTLIVVEFKSISTELGGILGALLQIGTETGGFVLTLRAAAAVLATIHSFFQVVVALAGQLGTAILNLIFRPLIGFNKIVAATVGLFSKDMGDAIRKAATDAEEFLDGVTQANADYTNSLNQGELALDKFVKRADKLDEVSGRMMEARENLSTSLRQAADEERKNTKELDAELEKKAINQKKYADLVAQLRVTSLTKQIDAQKAYFSALDQDDNRERQRTLDIIQNLKERRDAIHKSSTMKPIAGPPEDKSAGSDAAGFERAENIRIKQALAERLRDLKIELDNQRISYRQYYNDVTAAQTQALREQAEALDKQAAATKKPGRQSAIRAQATALRSEIAQITQDNEEKFRAATEKLHDEVETANIQLLKDEGKLAEARAIEVDKKFREKLAQLQVNGDTRGAEIITRLYNIDNAKVKLQELQNTVTQATSNFTAELNEINTLAENHVITQEEAQERLIAAYTRQRDLLLSMLPVMTALAEQTHDMNAIQEVEALNAKLTEMNVTIARLSDDWYEFKEAARQGLEAGLANFITASIMSAKTWKDAWIAAAQAVVGALAQVAARMFANLLIQRSLGFLGMFFGGGGAAAVLPGPGAVNAGIAAGVKGWQSLGIGFAEGGIVRGPGTSTSDSIAARLSTGEGVINAGGVRILGEAFIHEINQLGRYGPPSPRINHFRGGGIVERGPNESAGVTGNLTVRVRSNDSHILEVMESPRGARVQVDNMRKYRNASTRALKPNK